MLLKLFALFPLALGGVIPREAEVDYDGHEALRVFTKGDPQDVLSKIADFAYAQWNFRLDDHIDISLSRDAAEKLKELGFDWQQMHEDLGVDIKKEKDWGKYKCNKGELPSDDYFDTYHSYDDHRAFWEDLHAALPRNTEFISAGESYEGREIFGLKLFGDSRAGNCGDKEAIVWHGTVHAREWITAMVIEYITYQMIAGYRDDDKLVKGLLNDYDFYLFPVVNPDGFVYTQEVDRLWRKNRMPPPADADNQTCFGVDVNRNWPFQWDSGEQDGSDVDPCGQTYRGESAGNTPENTGIREYVDKVAADQGIKLYVDWHSYGQYFLSPYGYSCVTVAENSDAHVNLANGTIDVIEDVYGTVFTGGPTCQTLYAVNGGSLDYVKGEADAEFSYAIELRDKGDFGFVLPPDQIRPSGEEMWEGLKYMLAEM